MNTSVPNDRPHIAWLYRQLPDWRSRGILTEEAEAALREQYGPEPVADYRRITSILFAALASLLIGGGIILLFAYNWENISRPLRALLSIAPLLATYAAGYFTLTRRQEHATWKEGVAVGNICALAAAIALVGQTYNIPGNLATFLLTVSLLSLPTIHLFRSTGAALLYLVGIVIWRWESHDFHHHESLHDYALFWILLALVIPLLLRHLKTGSFHASRILLTAMIAAAAIAMPVQGMEEWGFLSAYALTASAIVATRALDDKNALILPGVSGLAHVGLFVILLFLSFGDTWKTCNFHGEKALGTTVLLSALVAGNIALWTLLNVRRKPLIAQSWAAIGLATIALRLATAEVESTHLVTALANLAGLALGATTIVCGYRAGRMGQVNGGLVVIGGILFMRFLDSDMSLVLRGCGLIAIGIAFILTNIILSRKMRKEKAS